MRQRVLAVFLGMFAACGGDDSGGPLTIDTIQGAMIDAYCDLYARCGIIDDASTCRGLDLDADFDADLRAAVHAGLVIFHPDKASQCLGAFRAASCDITQSVLSSRDEPAACDQVFEGTVGDAGTCALDEECISQVCAIGTCLPDTCCQGTCQGGTPPAPRPTLGESCAGSASCRYSFCDTATMTCVAPLADNSPCTTSSQCASSACVTQICRSRVGPGEACSTTAPCRDFNTYCSPTTMKCETFGLTGDPCTSEAVCSPIYTCSGTCTLGPLVGDPCSAQNGCIDSSYCEPATSICTAPKADGAMCQGDNECTSNNCDTAGTCTTPAICI